MIPGVFRPTTVEGLAPMLEYVGKWHGQDDAAYADPDDLLTAIRSAAESAKGLERSIGSG